jgi:hypothetical protein
MPTDYDFVQLYVRLEKLDAELKELREEVGQIKWYQQHGTTGPVAFSSAQPGHGAAYVGVLDYLSDKPLQWPNESYKDYLKRIGEYNEASAFEDDTK